MFDPVPAASETIDDVVARLQAGPVVVVGPAGSGVSGVLDAVGEASTAGVVVARGRPAERAVAGGVLAELAAGGLGIAPAPGDGLELVGPAWASALAAVEVPTLVVVHDTDVVDPLSVEALAYASARLGGAPVTLLFGAEAVPTVLADAGAAAVEVGAWPVEAIGRWLAETHQLVPDVAATLHAAADGLPGVAAALADDLTPRQQRGLDPVAMVPSTTHVAMRRFHDELMALPQDCRRLLCVVAAEPSGDVALTRRAAAQLEVDLEVLAPAEEAGFVEVAGRTVRFDHPLRRIAAYHLLAAPSRRTVHRVFALVLDAPDQAMRRVAHAAHGVVGTDDAVAADVARIARTLAGRGDHPAARRWWVLAAALSEDPDKRSEHLRRAAADEGAPLDKLTKAERRVADVVARGLSNKEAAAELFVSVKTVDAHLQSIYRKLAIRSRTELAVLVAGAGDQETP